MARIALGESVSAFLQSAATLQPQTTKSHQQPRLSQHAGYMRASLLTTVPTSAARPQLTTPYQAVG